MFRQLSKQAIEYTADSAANLPSLAPRVFHFFNSRVGHKKITAKASLSQQHLLSFIQPHLLHSPAYLEEQQNILQERHQDDSFTTVSLLKGKQFLGLTGTVNCVYGGVPIYSKFPKDLSESQQTQKFLGVKWALFEVKENVTCVLRTTKDDDVIFYVHDKFMKTVKRSLAQPGDTIGCEENSNQEVSSSKSKGPGQ